MARSLRIVSVGWGAIMPYAARMIAKAAPSARIVGVAVRPGSTLPDTLLPEGARRLAGPTELLPGFADLVIEAAGPDAVPPWGEAALKAGMLFSPLSVGALAREGVLEALRAAAETGGGRIIIPSGAIGGVDALRSASFAGLERVTHEVVKPVAAWRGTEAATLLDLDALSGPTPIIELSARQAALRFPQNANVCSLVALAGIGLERTRVRLVADPAAQRNSHVISAAGAAGCFTIRLENNPLPENPKTSGMTALSLACLVESLTQPVTF